MKMSDKTVPEIMLDQYEQGVNAERMSNYSQARQHYGRCVVLDKQINSIIADARYESRYMSDKIRAEKSMIMVLLHNFAKGKL